MDNSVGTDWGRGEGAGQGRAMGENRDKYNWTTTKILRKNTEKLNKFAIIVGDFKISLNNC